MKWMMLQKCTLHPMQLVFSMFLARLVTPEEMGLLGLTSIFFAVAGVLSECGFASALIRKQDRTEKDINTVFWFNVGMSLLMSIMLFLSAPLFVQFFQQPALLWLTRASAVMMFLNSFSSVHWTLYTARRDFKTPAIIQSITAMLSMPLCIGLAYAGWGVWALMTQSIFSGILSLSVVWFISPWKPRLLFSKRSFQEMFGYGSKLGLSRIVDAGFNHASNLVIGRFYSPASLAYYSRGHHLAYVFPSTVCSMLGNVTFPILATLQRDPKRLYYIYRKYLRLFTLSITWLCLFLAAYSKPFVAVMYGDQWDSAVVFCQLFCMSAAIYHIHVINLNLLSVMGRSDLFLRLEIIKKVLCISMMVSCATISVEAMCIGSVICSYICLFINSYFTKGLIRLSIWQQLMDYVPLGILASVTTWGTAYFVLQIPIPSIVQLLLGGVLSGLLFFVVLFYTKSETLNDLLLLVVERIPCSVSIVRCLLNRLIR